MYTTYIYRSIAVIAATAMLFACRSDLATIEAVTQHDKGPVESAFNVEIVYSELGYTRMILQAEQMDRYGEGDEPFLELPKGLYVVFFDTLKRETSSLSAKYAIHYEDTGIIKARNDVVVINEIGERLNTEELIWDQKNERIHSDTFVKVTTEDEVLYGEGFEADERFDQWRIKKTHGTFMLDTRQDPEPLQENR